MPFLLRLPSRRSVSTCSPTERRLLLLSCISVMAFEELKIATSALQSVSTWSDLARIYLLQCSFLSLSNVHIFLAVNNTNSFIHPHFHFFWLIKNTDTAAIQHLSHLFISAAVCSGLFSLLPWLLCLTLWALLPVYDTLNSPELCFNAALLCVNFSLKLACIYARSRNGKALIF